MTLQICVNQMMNAEPYDIPMKKGVDTGKPCPACASRNRTESANGVLQPYCILCARAACRRQREIAKARRKANDNATAITA